MKPQIREILTTETSSLEIIQSDAAVLRKVSTQRKLDLKEINIFIDKTDLGIRAHNVKKSLRLLSQNEIRFHSHFRACAHCRNEYIEMDALTFDECDLSCNTHNSRMFDNMSLLPELKLTFQDGLNQIWVKTVQKAISDGFYAANYNITVGGYGILPVNTYSATGKKNRCYLAEKSIFNSVDCATLPAKVRYFQQSNNTYRYYHQNFFRLNVLVNLDTSYDLSHALGQTDLTYGAFQRKNAFFEIYTATAQDVLEPVNSKHKCFCWRSKTLSPSKSMLRSRIDTLWHKADRIKSDVERERIKTHGKQAQSNSRHILSKAVDIFARQPLDQYLSIDDIFPLQLNASLEFLTKKKGTSTFPSILGRIGKNLHLTRMLTGNADKMMLSSENQRMKRAVPLSALLGLIKITGPYLIEKSPAVMKFLKTKLKGKLWKPPAVLPSSGNVSTILSKDLGRWALLEPKFDRLFFRFKFNQTFKISETNMTQLDSSIIDKLDNAVDQLKFYEEEIEEQLVPHIFQLLLPRIESNLRKGGQVLSSVSSSKSFSQVKFIFEQVLPSAVTHVSLFSFPYRMEGDAYYHLALSNSSFDLHHSHPKTASLSNYDCQTRLVSNQPALLKEVCSEQRFPAQEVALVMRMGTLELYLFRGPAQVSYQCHFQPRKHLDLINQFNLVLTHQACHIKGRLSNGKDYDKRPAQDFSDTDRFSKVETILLLHYDLIEMTTFSEKVTIWLGIIGAAVILVALTIIGMITYVIIWKGNWSNRIQNAVMDIEQADATEVRYRRSTSPHSAVTESRSLSPALYMPLNQLPSDVHRAEKVLEAALHRDQVHRMDHDTLKEIFPHLSEDSGFQAQPNSPMLQVSSPTHYSSTVKYATVKKKPLVPVSRV